MLPDNFTDNRMTEHGMSDIEKLENRINTLEIHISHQDSTIQELSDSVTEQWQTIDALTRKFNAVRERLLGLEDRFKTANSGEPPPPHF